MKKTKVTIARLQLNKEKIAALQTEEAGLVLGGGTINSVNSMCCPSVGCPPKTPTLDTIMHKCPAS